jgi:excisionase family DNA binding protein
MTRRSDTDTYEEIPQLSHDAGTPLDGDLLSMTIKTAARLSGFSRDTLYDLLAAGEVQSFLMGSRRFIDAASLRSYVQRRSAEPLTIRRSPQPRRRGRAIGLADQPSVKA